jgi:hypothetical protein
MERNIAGDRLLKMCCVRLGFSSQAAPTQEMYIYSQWRRVKPRSQDMIGRVVGEPMSTLLDRGDKARLFVVRHHPEGRQEWTGQINTLRKSADQNLPPSPPMGWWWWWTPSMDNSSDLNVWRAPAGPRALNIWPVTAPIPLALSPQPRTKVAICCELLCVSHVPITSPPVSSKGPP